MSEPGQRGHSSRWSDDHPGRTGEPFTGRRALDTRRDIKLSCGRTGRRNMERDSMFNVAEEMKRLNQIAKRNPAQIRKPLWRLLIRSAWLAQAWEEIRRNK